MVSENSERTRIIIPYDRQKAVSYAHTWAFKRNPAYYDFQKLGGDCTNFASQVLYAGSGVMNYKPIYGWYYKNINSRTASWSGVNFLYDFLINNKGQGPFAEEVDIKDIKPGDLIQLSFSGGNHFNHTPVVVQTGPTPGYDNIFIAAHTVDRDNYSLKEYTWKTIRFLHIKGVRK